MTEVQLDQGIILHDEIKTLKYILEGMNAQSDLCIHLHKNLGEDISIKDEQLVYLILGLIKNKKAELEREFKEL